MGIPDSLTLMFAGWGLKSTLLLHALQIKLIMQKSSRETHVQINNKHNLHELSGKILFWFHKTAFRVSLDRFEGGQDLNYGDVRIAAEFLVTINVFTPGNTNSKIFACLHKLAILFLASIKFYDTMALS